MLNFVLPEIEQTRQRGLSASTFVAQPFWQEIQKSLHELVQEKLNAIRGAKQASPETKVALVDRWLVAEEIVARIERIPQAAIEAARELGER